MNWRDILPQGIASWVAGAGGLTAIVGIVLSQTLLSPTYEVLHSGDVSVAYCADVNDQRTCSFHYEFFIGNSGKREQENLRVEWPLDLQQWGIETKVLDIVGSARKTAQPQILHAFESGKTVYTISGLMPNTMVRFDANCLACTPGQLQAMRQTRPVIAARGKVLEGDPRVSALQRGAVNALRLFGLFF